MAQRSTSSASAPGRSRSQARRRLWRRRRSRLGAWRARRGAAVDRRGMDGRGRRRRAASGPPPRPAVARVAGGCSGGLAKFRISTSWLAAASASSATRQPPAPSATTVPMGRPGGSSPPSPELIPPGRRHCRVTVLRQHLERRRGAVVAGHDRLDVAGRDGDRNAAVEVGEQDHPGGVLAGQDRCARSCRAHRSPPRPAWHGLALPASRIMVCRKGRLARPITRASTDDRARDRAPHAAAPGSASPGPRSTMAALCHCRSRAFSSLSFRFSS